MAEPVGFEGANFVYHAPDGMKDCGDLPVYRHPSGAISCWRLSEAELAEVIKTGVVWLNVVGGQVPPVSVSGEALVRVGAPGHDRPARAEPVIPLAARGAAARG